LFDGALTLRQLPPAARLEARDSIIQMVLATDMKLHFEARALPNDHL